MSGWLLMGLPGVAYWCGLADAAWTAIGLAVGGAGMVFLWKLVLSQLGGVFGIYELLPAFLFSAICIVVVSLATKAPAKEIEEDFDAVRAGTPIQEQ